MGPRAKNFGRPGGDPPWTLQAEGPRTLVRQLIPPTRLHAAIELADGSVVEHTGTIASVRARMAIDGARGQAGDAAEIDSFAVNIATVGLPP